MSEITSDPEIAWGAAVFTETRVPVDVLFEYLETGETIDEFLRQFPTVSREAAVSVLRRARELIVRSADRSEQTR
jgi:uncharacterized protein (DUF433 family)